MLLSVAAALTPPEESPGAAGTTADSADAAARSSDAVGQHDLGAERFEAVDGGVEVLVGVLLVLVLVGFWEGLYDDSLVLL